MPPEPLTATESEATATETDAPEPSRRVPRPPAWLLSAPAAAVLTWAVTLPVAFWLPSRLDINPFVQRSADLPLAVLLGAATVLGAIGLRWRAHWLAGVAAGGFASYVALVVRSALSGTPFGYSDFYAVGDRISAMGDSGRIAAMAVRYTETWASTDGIVGTVPSEYPPLYPWLVGRTAVLLDVPAWTLMGAAQALGLSLALLAGFVLWARIVPPFAALLIGPLWLLTFAEPTKPYELLALSLMVPLVLSTIVRPPAGRLPWPVAGALYAVMFLTYYGYAAFAAIGVLALAWRTWRREPDRGAYLRYLAKIAATVAVLASWFALPYAGAMLTGGQQVGDVYSDGRLSANPFPFLTMTLFGLIQLGGLAALLWYARSQWWAGPLLALVGGAYAYYGISMVRWVLTAHTGLFYYAQTLITGCLLAAAVLGARCAVPALAARCRRSLAAGSGVAVVAVVIVFTGFGFWYEWMPVNKWKPSMAYGSVIMWERGGYHNQWAARAHYMYRPDGSQPRHAALVEPLLPRLGDDGQWRYLPIAAIQRTVREVRPDDRLPTVLCYDEQLFSFLPWKGYLGVDRVASYGPARWPDRWAEMRELVAITDPARFAAASARTRFGSLDVFVLEKDGGGLIWRGLQVPPPHDLRFSYAQFRGFVVRDLGHDTVVAVRRP